MAARVLPTPPRPCTASRLTMAVARLLGHAEPGAQVVEERLAPLKRRADALAIGRLQGLWSGRGGSQGKCSLCVLATFRWLASASP